MTDYRQAPRRTNNSPLAQARRAKGLTQAELGDMIGVCYAKISEYERGRNLPRYPTMRKLAEALETDIETLFPEE